MTAKITKLKGQGYDLAVKLSGDNGMPYHELLAALNTPAGVYDYLSAVAALIDNMTDAAMRVGGRFSDNLPWLRQGADEGGEWEGQPVVCDGWFEMINGELHFSGSRYTHGSGGPATRKVMPWDIIEWYRVQPLEDYKKGVHDTPYWK